ncbi:extracellular solute-binding protein [Microbacterium halophytorum]|uniref:extracellular solute-binding protein n=1 Tax=Microbacterium halophytorum TaxID=2067568 RepID=UPI000CFC3AC4|nr:extracellular solute-binding protein [Microbacterium halophytorum]
MTRKRALGAAAAGIAAVGALAGCGPVATDGSAADASTGDSSLTVFISGDTNVQDLWEKGIIPAYQEANPEVEVSTTIDLHGEHDQQTVAKLTTATEAGDAPGFDLIDAGFVVSSAAEADTLLEVDADSIDGLASVAQPTIDAGKGVGIPYRASSVLLAYDTEKVAEPPRTLDGLLAWIEENPGQFAYNSPSTGGSGGAFVTTVLDSFLSEQDQEALRAGYAQELEAGWDAGFERLSELGESVYQGGVYPNGNNQVLDLLASGEIAMAPVWSDQFITGQKSGLVPETVGYTQISDPSFTGNASYLGIPRTSEHTDAAIDLVNFVLSSEGQQIIAEQISGYPVVSLDTLPTEVADKFADADPSALRPGYYSEVGSDMANEWDKRVP